MYERYHLPECYTQGEIFNVDPLHLKGSEKWLLSLRNGSEKLLVSLHNGSEKRLVSLRNVSEKCLVSLHNAVTETD